MSARATLVSLAVAATLVGCGERNAGVSSSNEQSAGTSESLSIKNTKSATVSEDRTATTTLPLPTVIIAALRLSNHTVSLDGPTALELALATKLEAAGSTGTLSADQSTLLAHIRGARARQVRALLTEALAPLAAWPVQPFDMRSGGATPDGRRWTAERYAALELANAVVTAVAGELSRQALYSADDAREKALAAFNTLDHASLLRTYDAARSAARLQVADGQKVAFTLANGAGVEIGPAGPTLSRDGRLWFAADTASGQTYQVALARAESTSLAKSRDTSRDVSASASQKVDASAAVK